MLVTLRLKDYNVDADNTARVLVAESSSGNGFMQVDFEFKGAEDKVSYTVFPKNEYRDWITHHAITRIMLAASELLDSQFTGNPAPTEIEL